MLKAWPLPHTVRWCVGVGGNQVVITIQTSTMTRLSATVSKSVFSVRVYAVIISKYARKIVVRKKDK